MKLKEMKIGYVPYLPDLSQPGDRRRFPHFAKRNQIPFEIARVDHEYDVVLLTATSNLTKWLEYKKIHPGTKFIFEMTDSLLFDPNLFTRFFKGLGRYILRKEDRIFLNYKSLLIRWIRMADAVICSSNRLLEIIKPYNHNAFVSLDYMKNEIRHHKNNFMIGGKMKLVWEGQGSVLPQFMTYKNMLEQVSSFCELHIISDEQYQVWGGTMLKPTRKLLDKLPIKTIFHKWEMHKNYEEMVQGDCGIIPLDTQNKMAWYKPANKLISYWFSGIPTVVSNTPAYVQLMQEAGIDLYCSSTEQWVKTLKQIYNMSAEERAQLSRKAYENAEKNYSPECLDDQWKAIFRSLGYSCSAKATV